MGFEDLTRFTLRKGSHPRPEQGLCVLEAVAWFEGELHSDHPACVCPVIGHYCRALNDQLGERRQDLVAYIPRLVGTTAGPAIFHARLELLIRAYLALGGGRRITDGLRRRLAKGTLPAATTSFALAVVCDGITITRPADAAIELLDHLLALGAPSPGLSRDPAALAAALVELLEA